MSTSTDTAGVNPPMRVLALDVPLKVSPEEEAFFTETTGIKDHEELFCHIKSVQHAAYHNIAPCEFDFVCCRERTDVFRGGGVDKTVVSP